MHERWTIAGAAVSDSASEGSVAGYRIGAIDFFKMEIGKTANQTRNVSASGLDFNRNGDGVLIVLYHKNNRQTAVGGAVQSFPELTLTGGAIAEGNVGDFIAMERHTFELSIISLNFFRGTGMGQHVARNFSATDRLQDLRTSR